MRQKEVFTPLKDKRVIGRIFLEGKKAYSKNLLARYMPASDHNAPLNILWAVPKKTKTAVERNRMKRILRDAFFLSVKRKLAVINKPLNLAVIPRPEFTELTHKQRIDEASGLLNSIQKSVLKDHE